MERSFLSIYGKYLQKIYYDYDYILYKRKSLGLWELLGRLGRKLRQATTTVCNQATCRRLPERQLSYCFVQWRSQSIVFPFLFPSHTDIKIIGSHTQLSKSKFPYMQNMVIGSMFSCRAALLVNEIMTTTFFELFELRNSINKRPYYFTILVTH